MITTYYLKWNKNKFSSITLKNYSGVLLEEKNQMLTENLLTNQNSSFYSFIYTITPIFLNSRAFFLQRQLSFYIHEYVTEPHFWIK